MWDVGRRSRADAKTSTYRCIRKWSVTRKSASSVSGASSASGASSVSGAPPHVLRIARRYFIDELKRTIREHLSSNRCQYFPGADAHANPLNLSIVRLCFQLVVFGHYREAELPGVVEEVRRPLFPTLVA